MKTIKKVAGLISILTVLFAKGVFYPTIMIVTDIQEDAEKQILTLETATGFTYQMEANYDDYYLGDLVSVVMYNNNTKDITDDSIIWARYGGFWLEDWGTHDGYLMW